MENSNENTAQAKRRKRQEDGKRQDLEENLSETRKGHTKLLGRRGELEAAKNVRVTYAMYHASPWLLIPNAATGREHRHARQRYSSAGREVPNFGIRDGTAGPRPNFRIQVDAH